MPRRRTDLVQVDQLDGHRETAALRGVRLVHDLDLDGELAVILVVQDRVLVLTAGLVKLATVIWG